MVREAGGGGIVSLWSVLDRGDGEVGAAVDRCGGERSGGGCGDGGG